MGVGESPVDPDGMEDLEDFPPTKARSRKVQRRRNQNSTILTFIGWSAFIAIWLFFFAVDFGIFENIAVAIASLLFALGIVGMIYAPIEAGPVGSAKRIRLSIFIILTEIAFIILWIPFFWEYYTGYQNMAVILLSFIIFILVAGATWIGAAPDLMQTQLGRRPAAGITVLILWLAFLDYWLWFQAESYPWEQNLAIGILSLMIVGAIEIGIFWKMGDRKVEVKGIGIFYGWLIVLFIWFWFFGEPFNVYQNFAVFFISFVAFFAIAYFLGTREARELESLDWEE